MLDKFCHGINNHAVIKTSHIASLLVANNVQGHKLTQKIHNVCRIHHDCLKVSIGGCDNTLLLASKPIKLINTVPATSPMITGNGVMV